MVVHRRTDGDAVEIVETTSFCPKRATDRRRISQGPTGPTCFAEQKRGRTGRGATRRITGINRHSGSAARGASDDQRALNNVIGDQAVLFREDLLSVSSAVHHDEAVRGSDESEAAQ